MFAPAFRMGALSRSLYILLTQNLLEIQAGL